MYVYNQYKLLARLKSYIQELNHYARMHASDCTTFDTVYTMYVTPIGILDQCHSASVSSHTQHPAWLSALE